MNLLSHLREIVAAARQAGIPVFFVPHHRWEPGDYARWNHANHTQLATGKRQTFAKSTWGGEFHADFKPQEGDVIIQEHWAQSGFANTDLDYQLKQHGIGKIIIRSMTLTLASRGPSSPAPEAAHYSLSIRYPQL